MAKPETVQDTLSRTAFNGCAFGLGAIGALAAAFFGLIIWAVLDNDTSLYATGAARETVAERQRAGHWLRAELDDPHPTETGFDVPATVIAPDGSQQTIILRVDRICDDADPGCYTVGALLDSDGLPIE